MNSDEDLKEMIQRRSPNRSLIKHHGDRLAISMLLLFCFLNCVYTNTKNVCKFQQQKNPISMSPKRCGIQRACVSV